ncbi:MAG: hypothetical protein IJ637_04265 [Prevotella sp.]|nr:hypothetical protein [Prevotella sp.]
MANKYIIGVALLLLTASCGRQWQAKTAVKVFMDTKLQRDVSYLSFSKVDSTRVIGDSLITALRDRGGRRLNYRERTGKTLLHIRARYVLDGDTMSSTFYMNRDADGIVAFKDN